MTTALRRLTFAAMGFDPITIGGVLAAASSAVNAVGSYAQGRAYKAQSNATLQATETQAKLQEQEADANKKRALTNSRMMHRNANSEMASVVADNAASNLVNDGTALQRSLDTAGRLEREINIQTDQLLERSDQLRKQAALTRWNGQLQAISLKTAAKGAYIGAVGSLLGGFSQAAGTFGKAQSNSSSSAQESRKK